MCLLLILPPRLQLAHVAYEEGSSDSWQGKPDVCVCVCVGGGGVQNVRHSLLWRTVSFNLHVFVCVRFGLSVQVSRFLAFGSLMTGYTRQSGLHLAVAHVWLYTAKRLDLAVVHVVGRLSVRLRRDGLTEWSIRFLYTGWL